VERGLPLAFLLFFAALMHSVSLNFHILHGLLYSLHHADPFASFRHHPVRSGFPGQHTTLSGNQKKTLEKRYSIILFSFSFSFFFFELLPQGLDLANLCALTMAH